MVTQPIRQSTPAHSPAYTVLLVETVASERDVLRRYLLADTGCCYTVLESDSAAAALALCQSQQVDGILTSNALSDSTGLKFIQALQEQLKGDHPPVVIVSHEADPAIAVRSIKLGADNYLVKQTLTPEQLQQAVRGAIETGRSQLQLYQQLNRDLANRVAELQTLIDIAPVGIAIALDPSCAEMQCNAYMRQMLGVSVGNNISKSAPVEEQPSFQVFQNGQEVPSENLPMQVAVRLGVDVLDTEIEIRRSDGTARQLLSYATPLRNAQDEIRGTVGAFLDITERNRIEAELRTREEQLRLFIKHVPAGVAMFDREMQYIVASDRWLTSYGVEHQNIVGRSHYEIFPDIPDQWKAIHQRCLAGAIESCEEDCFSRADGSLMWIRWEVHPWRTDAHEIGGIIIFSEVITERKQAEARLQEREATIRRQFAELEGIYATAPVGLCFHDTDLRFVRINDRLAEINGVPSAEHLGRTVREVLPELADALEPLHRRVIESGEPVLDVEIQGRTKAQPQTERHWVASYYPLKDVRGHVLGVNVVVQDISEAKQAQAEREQLMHQLELEHSFLEQTLQQMPSGVAIAEAPSGKLLFHNDEAIRLLCHSMYVLEDYSGYTQYGAFHADGQAYQPEEYPIARAVLAGEVVKAEEMSYRRGDGTITTLSVNAAPIIDQQGQQVAAVSTFEDVSERKQAECDRLLLAQIVESSRDAIMGLTLDRQIISWNPAAERIFGYTRAEILGQDLSILVPANRAHEPATVLDAIRQGKYVNQFETVRQRKDGGLVNVSITISPIKNARDEVIGFSGTVRDITRQKRLEQEREQLFAQAQSARAEAEAASRSKDDFVAMVAHELRSPLNAIMGWAKLLQTRQFDPATTHKALETIVRNTQAQVQLVEDLLDISRMVRGTLQLTTTSVNLVNVIETALETVRPTAEAKQLHLEAQIHNGAQISGDVHRLQQIVLNLLTNAIKFTPEGGFIQVLLDQQGTHARIQVIDTGKGISADFLPHIFERFRQDQQNTTTKQDLGLGLAIVQHLVEMHGGSVTAESQGENYGTTFTVTLPLLGSKGTESLKMNHSPVPSSPSYSIAPPPHHPLNDIRVLLVDDEPDMLSLTAFILEEHGAVAQTATNVPSALERLPKFQPHILLSDIAMPEQDGYELLQHMRARPGGGIPAIALTAYACQTRREQSLRAGFQQHLTKPVEPEELINAILRAVRQRE
ncbi:PAS domain S-box protein [Leptolyngbya sp. PL-A3]|uniref:PAS domain S-box protein n=1 Tax=Leptolyngbya sp. PL-A3 TaxID=2933911 RepID=UPI0032972F94